MSQRFYRALLRFCRCSGKWFNK